MQQYRALVLLAVASVLFAGMLAVVPPAHAEAPQEDTQNTEAKYALIYFINQERAAVGCPALSYYPQLEQSAQAHVNDMVNRRYLSHVTPEGLRVEDRIAAVGYPWAYVGEDIAAGINDPAAVVAQWMQSERHKGIILDCTYLDIGVGYRYVPDDQPGMVLADGSVMPVPFYDYWVINLGRQQGM